MHIIQAILHIVISEKFIIILFSFVSDFCHTEAKLKEIFRQKRLFISFFYSV